LCLCGYAEFLPPAVTVESKAATSGRLKCSHFAVNGFVACGGAGVVHRAKVTLSNQNVQVWTNLSSDSRALLRPGSSNRIASAWTKSSTQNSAFTIDVNLTDTNPHQVAVYCVDWLGTGTGLEKVEVFEASDISYSHPLDTRDFKLPPNGVYFVWRLSGHKILRITKPDATVGNKAMLSELFFGGGG